MDTLIFTPQEQTKVQQLLERLQTVFKTQYPTELSEEERKQYNSINEQARLLISKTQEYQLSNPEMGTPDVDWETFLQEYNHNLLLQSKIESLTDTIRGLLNAKILLDWNNFQTALLDYNYTRYKFESNPKLYSEKQKTLKQCFNRKSKKSM